jgi:multiple sugar transport system ATP-binding protein
VHFSTESKLRAEVLGTEYLGTSQIVTCRTAQGVTLRAKVGVHIPAQRGDSVGLEFDTAQVSLFDQASGRALKTSRHARPVASLSARHRLGPAAPAFRGAAHG